MECLLYCPVYGYYEKEEDTPGRRGDYFTSASVGSLFGDLLALQFSEWLTQNDAASLQDPPHTLKTAPDGLPLLGAPASRRRVSCPPGRETPTPPRSLKIVEAGAHTGALAKDILTWLSTQRPDLCESVEYCIIEPSARRQLWQRRTLNAFLSQVRWFGSLSELMTVGRDGGIVPNQRPIRGIMFSNELFDAMPVHRVAWDAQQSLWFEWGVAFCNGHFQWTRLREDQSEVPLCVILPQANLQFQASSSETCGLANRFLKNLPDGFILEICPAANQWWAQAAGMLESGKLLTIDYGFSENELLSPERLEGTLRAYHRHHLTSDVLANPGEQDITAHVNFSSLRRIGEAAGLKTEAFVSQEQFLTRIASRIFEQHTPFSDWTPEKTRQFQTLTHPNHLGHAFRVLVQSR